MTDHAVDLTLPVATCLVVAAVLGWGARRVRIPALVGSLLAGVVLGPDFFGAMAPRLHAWVFIRSDAQRAGLEGLSEVCLLLLVGAGGLHASPSQFRSVLKPAAWVTLLGSVVAATGLTVLLWGLSSIGVGGVAGSSTVYLGCVLSVCAIPVLVAALVEVRAQDTHWGGVAVSSAFFTDVLAWGVLGVVLYTAGKSDSSDPWAFVRGIATVTLVSVGVAVGLRGLKRRTVVTSLAPIAVWCGLLAGAALATALSVDAVVGAFVAGLAMSDGVTDRAREGIQASVEEFFGPVYFAATLTTTSVAGAFSWVGLSLFAGLLVLGVGFKWPLVYGGARLGGVDRAEAALIATSCNARGVIELAMAAKGLSADLISAQMYVVLVAFGVASSVGAPLVLRRQVSRLGERESGGPPAPAHAAGDDVTGWRAACAPGSLPPSSAGRR